MIKARLPSFKAKYQWDEAAANRPVEFIERFCTFTTGEFRGKPFLLQPWQRDLIRWIYGWINPETGVRVTQRAFVFLPRKNGKTELASAIALYELYGTGQQADVISAAGSRDQAKICFNSARDMVSNNRVLKKLSKIHRNEISAPNASTYKTISSDAGLAHGGRYSAAICDELHVWAGESGAYLLDTVRTAMGARRSSLLFVITTAGNDVSGVCYDLYKHAKAVASGEVIDDGLLPVIYEADDEADISDPAVWKAANPNYGVSVFPSFLEAQAKQALLIPRFTNGFKQLHLNQWVSSFDRWISPAAWAGCEHKEWPDLRGLPAWVGVDLSTTKDLTAVVAAIPYEGKIYIEPYAFLPMDRVDSAADGAPYPAWVQSGKLIACNGSTIDQDAVIRKIYELAEKYDLQEVAIDPWRAGDVIKHVADHGIKIYEHPQTMPHMSGPSRSFEKAILDRKLVHDGHPVLRWNVFNTVVITDTNENFKPSKKKGHSSGRIDLCVASIMAFGRAVTADPHSAPQMEYVTWN